MNTRNKVKKYFFFDEFHDNDSPKRKPKKPKKEIKALLKKGIAPTPSYAKSKADQEPYNFTQLVTLFLFAERLKKERS